MRKATVEFVLSPQFKALYGDLFEKIEYAELLQMLRIDFDRGIKIAIAKYRVKDGISLKDLFVPLGGEVLDVLKVEGKEQTCLVKGTVPEEFRPFMKEMDLDLIWDLPSYFTPDKVVYSVIGDQPNLKKFFEKIALFGEIKSISCQKASFQSYNVLSCLTARQKNIILEAKKSGYYEYPRRVNADKLSERLGIGKSATIEHLRKAEGRIISQILAGY